MTNQHNGSEYNSESGEIDVTHLIFATAIKTAHTIIISGILIFVLLIYMFPFSAIKIFESVGLKERALSMANIAIQREQDKERTPFSGYTDALYYKMVLSEQLYLEGKSSKSYDYLMDIYKTTYEYSQIEKIAERNSIIDTKNLSYVAPLAHANVFSFSDRVCRLNYFAALRLDKDDEFLLENRIVNIADFRYELDSLDSQDFYSNLIAYSNHPKIALEFSIFLGQLTDYINFNLIKVQSAADNNSDELVNFGNQFSLIQFEKIMTILAKKISYFEDFAFSYIDYFEETDLYARQTQLYFIRCLGIFYDQMLQAAEYLEKDVDIWSDLIKVNAIDQDISVADYYYGVMLPEYTVFFLNRNA